MTDKNKESVQNEKTWFEEMVDECHDSPEFKMEQLRLEIGELEAERDRLKEELESKRERIDYLNDFILSPIACERHTETHVGEFVDCPYCVSEKIREDLATVVRVLVKIRDCDWTKSLPDRVEDIRDLARSALSSIPDSYHEDVALLQVVEDAIRTVHLDMSNDPSKHRYAISREDQQRIGQAVALRSEKLLSTLPG